MNTRKRVFREVNAKGDLPEIIKVRESPLEVEEFRFEYSLTSKNQNKPKSSFLMFGGKLNEPIP